MEKVQRWALPSTSATAAVLTHASRPSASRAYRAAVSLADAAFGRWGNKLQVTARRAA